MIALDVLHQTSHAGVFFLNYIRCYVSKYGRCEDDIYLVIRENHQEKILKRTIV